MFRRDEFLDLLGAQNSSDNLELKMTDLEKYVDDELSKDENIIKMINLTTATSQSLENGLEIVDIIKPTNIVHRDITVVSDNKILAGSDFEVVSYAVWSDSLKYPNNSDASSTPWDDKTIAETSVTTFSFDGKMKIKLPDNTNKFLAKMLADKYMNIGKIDKEGSIIGGYWSQSNRANNKDNSPNSANTLLTNAVRVLFDKTNNLVYLEFKLF